ncbi:MoxR family ATPase [Fulvivirgaceae bacterium PWU4]|uniref:MoxR family ATPase n=1 Tax=Chryseosolibacter histidini TaxID=2782349 RepID=A0AAP2DLR6_9BACT|nr:MoxR family ATPase [Chryseosolibacter histidini]MBT1698701.1 MoxR family ATPase [Chryseosolibacter histidini]
MEAQNIETRSDLQQDIDLLNQRVMTIKREVAKVIVGQDAIVDLILAGFFTGGHILLEGVPGIAKTMTAKLVAKAVSASFSRIQFTPDLMPTDVTGTTIFNLKTSEFNFNKGPIFANLVLIDEINRAPAKTQSSLFEVMEERQITIDGTTYIMEFPFLVIATQNPIEHEGTYRLPEAQLDRFLFRLKLKYPTLEQEIEILKKFRNDFGSKVAETVNAVISKQELKACQDLIEKILIKDEIIEYIAKLVDNTRNNGDLLLGASPRASLAIMRAAKAIAAMNGRDFVTPDDVKYVAHPVLNHRIILTAEREMEGVDSEDVIREITERVEVPR